MIRSTENCEPDGPIPFGRYNLYDYSIDQWSHRYTDEPTAFEVLGYNFQSPGDEVFGSVGPASKNPFVGQYCEYSEDIKTNDEAGDRARLLAERARVRSDTVTATGYCSLLQPAMRFELTGHPNDAENARYMVTQITHRAVDAYYWEQLKEHINPDPDFKITRDDYENTFCAIPGNKPFRPQALHQKPKIDGHHLAKVCGDPKLYPWMDEYGRVEVTFPWDVNQTTSCYIRVAQPWAGDRMGVQFSPRPGDEVIVKYLSGDIDHPIIVGSLSNGNNPPIYPLPQQGSSSGFRTQSFKTTDTTQRNGLQFVDTKGSEAINIDAEQDFNIDVENNFQLQIGNNQAITVEGDFTSTTVVGDIRYGAKSITLKVGPSEIIINEQGVFFNAPALKIITNNGMTDLQGAARVGDQTICPQMGHGEGTIHTGSPNVFINGAPVARNGDPIHCEDGSTDTITQGIPGLYVNGRQAAALNHYTQHNGVIQTSSAGVMLGGGSPQGTPSNNLCWPSIDIPVDGFESPIEPFELPIGSGMYIVDISATLLSTNLNLTQKNCVNPLTFNTKGFSVEARDEAQGVLMNFKINGINSLGNSPPELTLYNNYGDYTVELTKAPPEFPGEFHFTGGLTKNNPFNNKNGEWIITGQVKMEIDVRLIPANSEAAKSLLPLNTSVDRPDRPIDRPDRPADRPGENDVITGGEIVYYITPALAQASFSSAEEALILETAELMSPP